MDISDKSVTTATMDISDGERWTSPTAPLGDAPTTPRRTHRPHDAPDGGAPPTALPSDGSWYALKYPTALPIGLSIAWMAAAAIPKASRPESTGSSRNRAVAAARAAREAAVADMPAHLGGLAIDVPPPQSRPSSAAPTGRAAPAPGPPGILPPSRRSQKPVELFTWDPRCGRGTSFSRRGAGAPALL